MIARWGHASVFVPSPPSILIQGGKTDPTSSFTYSSSPNSADTILLPLTTAFTTLSPPFSLLAPTGAPTYAWHTLTPLISLNGDWLVLSFGGDGGPSEPVETLADSTCILSVNPAAETVNFTHEAVVWANQPPRRIYHSAASLSTGKKTYITGGLKDDGSGAGFADVYEFDPASSAFTTLPDLPQGLYHHSSVLLPNGTLVIFGGVFKSPATGNSALLPLSTLYTLDTNSNAAGWTTRSIAGAVPDGRRGASSVLNTNGTKAFLFGGADADLGSMVGDNWELDLDSCVWRQVFSADQGPGGRYDYSAIAVGGEQVIIFGGYGSSGSVSPDLFIFDTSSKSWLKAFEPITSSPSTTSGPGASGTLAAEGGTTVGSGSVTPGAGTAAGTSETTGAVRASRSGSVTETTLGSSGLSEYSGSATQWSPSSSSTKGSGGAGSFLSSVPVRIAFVLGIVALVCLAAGVFLLRYRRLRRRQALFGRSTDEGPGSGRGRDRPYGSREKGGVGLVEDIAAEPDVILEGREKSATVGLGMGALGAGLASISTRFVGRSTTRDPYSVLPDEQEAGGPVRKSTRRVGTGIRLVGPRNSSGNDKYAPVRLGCATRPLSSAKDLRMSMLHDEDSRSFARAKKEDWVLPSDDSEARWKPAHSLLGQERETIEEEDPFEDDESLHPPLRGGPVPTPRDSRSDLDPFEDFTNRRSSYVEASGSGSGQYELSAFSPSDDFGLNALPTLPPTTQQSSDSSMPRSQRSGQTTSTSDVEEGVVHHAQIASLQTASTVSPVETAHLPIKRSESFFRRLAAGGISSLLSRQPINPRRELNIRDPAPLPTLWQVDSPNEPPYPPSSWDATALRPPQPSRTKGPSLTSLNSARSMRDMVIIQREQTNSSIETEAVIEMASPLLSEPERPVGSGHHRHGLTIGSETPGSIVFNGAESVSPALLPSMASGPSRPIVGPPMPNPDEAETPLLAQPEQTTSSPSTPTKPLPASLTDFPVPSPMLSHRRPVRDVVNSINRRGNVTPLSLFSPASQYSPAPVSPQGTSSRSSPVSRPSTMYEAVRRSTLTVANPDGRGDRMGSG